MTWGATAYTPIVTYNQPPFGFHEITNPPNYARCNKNPYLGTELLKAHLRDRFAEMQNAKEEQNNLNYNLNNSNTWQLRECFTNQKINYNILFYIIIAICIFYFLFKNNFSLNGDVFNF